MSNKKNISNPASPNYKEKIRNKSNEKTPFGENEPSPNTTYK
ncbi:hypothetical protein [Clostridium sp.]|nr:hypothetical protein [Clostridium sp.]